MAKVTMKEIAQHFNVSVAAVSKAINDCPDISDELKKEIREYARSVNYQLNYLGRSLRISKTNMIGVVVVNLNSPFYSGMLVGITDVMDNSDISVLVFNSNESLEREKKHINTLKQRNADGFLIIPVTKNNEQWLESKDGNDIPSVIINYNLDISEICMGSWTTLFQNGYEIGCSAAKLLIEKLAE